MAIDTLIIGGGIVGLGIGWKLAQRGESVTILERGAAGREASWAAAGLLAPATEVHYQEDRNLKLGLESMRLYPDFVAEVEAYTGRRVDYRTEGAISVASTVDDAADLQALFEYQLELGLPVRKMSGEAAREMEPSLSPYITSAVFCPMDHHIDNRLLVDALKGAYLKAGGTLLEHTEVQRVSIDGGAYRGVEAGGQHFTSRRLLIAAGSWSGLLAGLPESIRPPVRPVKGQLFSVKSPRPAFLTHFIRSPRLYIAPKSDGRIVMGATVEEMGFNRDLTAGALYTLLKEAWDHLPGVYELPILETWCGFRPGSRDNSPLLGESAVPGVFFATGHYRNGILFTPVTVNLMSKLLLDKENSELLQQFSPKRFAA
ncbi:MAG TPA: glycine oxidase ThiO [bacterium]